MQESRRQEDGETGGVGHGRASRAALRINQPISPISQSIDHVQYTRPRLDTAVDAWTLGGHDGEDIPQFDPEKFENPEANTRPPWWCLAQVPIGGGTAGSGHSALL